MRRSKARNFNGVLARCAGVTQLKGSEFYPKLMFIAGGSTIGQHASVHVKVEIGDAAPVKTTECVSVDPCNLEA